MTHYMLNLQSYIDYCFAYVTTSLYEKPSKLSFTPQKEKKNGRLKFFFPFFIALINHAFQASENLGNGMVT